MALNNGGNLYFDTNSGSFIPGVRTPGGGGGGCVAGFGWKESTSARLHLQAGLAYYYGMVNGQPVTVVGLLVEITPGVSDWMYSRVTKWFPEWIVSGWDTETHKASCVCIKVCAWMLGSRQWSIWCAIHNADKMLHIFFNVNLKYEFWGFVCIRWEDVESFTLSLSLLWGILYASMSLNVTSKMLELASIIFYKPVYHDLWIKWEFGGLFSVYAVTVPNIV